MQQNFSTLDGLSVAEAGASKQRRSNGLKVKTTRYDFKNTLKGLWAAGVGADST